MRCGAIKGLGALLAVKGLAVPELCSVASVRRGSEVKIFACVLLMCVCVLCCVCCVVGVYCVCVCCVIGVYCVCVYCV